MINARSTLSAIPRSLRHAEAILFGLHSERAGPEITAACFTREKSFLICRDRRRPAVHFQTQASVARTDLSAESDRGSRTVHSNQTSEGRWADATGQIYKWKITSGVIKELYRVSLLGWVTGQSGWIKSIDVQH